jgi:hypothetical protein
LFELNKKEMPGKSKTIGKIVNVLQWVMGGLGLITMFIPGLQPVGAILGVTSGLTSLATGVSDMVTQKYDGTLTTANKIENITNIVGGALGMLGPVAETIGLSANIGAKAARIASTTSKVLGGLDKVNTVVGMTASVPNTISNIFRGRDAYDNYMSLT